MLLYSTQIPNSFPNHSKFLSYTVLVTNNKHTAKKKGMVKTMKTTMIKFASATLAALITTGALALPVCAANPSDDTTNFSFHTGQSAYEEMMEEHGYSEDDTVSNPDYSFNTGRTSNEARKSAFANMPTAEDVPEEELNAFFTENGLGEGAAFENGEYNEDLKSSYSFNPGRSAYEARQAESGQAETE